MAYTVTAYNVFPIEFMWWKLKESGFKKIIVVHTDRNYTRVAHGSREPTLDYCLVN